MLFKFSRRGSPVTRQVVVRPQTLPALRIRMAGRLTEMALAFQKKKEDKLKESLKSENCADFSAIYARFRKPIFKYVSKRVANPVVVEEIVQEIFLKIYQYRESFNHSQRLSPWVWTIARNALFDHFRKVRPDQAGDEPICFQEIACDRANAEEKLLDESRRAQLIELMSRLPESQRHALFLSVVEKFSYQQISSRMNLSLGAVKSLINRGRTSLKKTLEQDLSPESL